MNKLRNLVHILKKNKWLVALFVFTTAIFLTNTLHETYPDEFDNILGGWFITQGKLPYSGFFTHHGPVPYFIASFITLFSGRSFVAFRLLYAFFLVGVVFSTYFFLRKRIGKKETSFYPLFIGFLGIEATYFWLHMLLADNVAALFLLPAYALIVLKALFRKKFTLVDVGAISIFLFVALFSSLTYVYLSIVLGFSALFLYYKDHIYRPVFSIRNLFPVLFMIFPPLLFFIYLFITESFNDYLYQNYTFNVRYYIYNYPRSVDAQFINPVRYAILIAHWFFVNFYTLLLGVKSFEFSFPVNVTMAVGNVAVLFYLLFTKRYKLFLFVFLMVVYSNVRSNPLDSKETDYQSGVYALLSFFNIFFILKQLYESINGKVVLAQRVIFSFLLLLTGTYFTFAFLHLVFKFNQKAVSKYMGDMPLIYDRPRLAPIINTVVSKDDYMWIGPFEFEDLFYAEGKIPSKYHILIYGIGASDKIRAEMLSDFEKNKPKVIMFDSQFVYLGKSVNSYGKFFMDFLKKHYITLLRYKEGNVVYRSIAPIHPGEKIDIESKLYIRKDVIDEVVERLLRANYIKQVNN